MKRIPPWQSPVALPRAKCLMFAISLLSGCQQTPNRPEPVVTIQKEAVPAPIPCAVDLPDRPPAWPIDTLKVTDSPGVKVQTLVIDIASRIDYINKVDAAIEPCRLMKPKP